MRQYNSASVNLCRRLLCLLILLLIACAPAFAQISYASDKQQRKAQARYLKEAEKTDARYKASHLNTSAFTFKKGKASRKRVKANEVQASYDFNEKGAAEPKFFLRRKNKRSKTTESN